MHTLFYYIFHLVQNFGLLGIAGSMIIENIGIPFPTEGAFLVAQHLITNHHYSFWFMYWYLVMTQVLGAVIAYGIGRLISKYVLTHTKPKSKFWETQKKVTAWYDRYGSVTVFATRLIGYVRPWSSLVAGVAKFAFWPFLLWTFLGTILFVYPTMRVTRLLVVAWAQYPGLHLLISFGALLLFFGVTLYGLGKSRREQKKSSDSSGKKDADK